MDATSPLLERIAALHPKRIDLSLGRLEQLLERLDHPERKLPPVVHIAGTNGKGSVTAMLRAMLEADASRAKRREAVDKVAAAIILQGALDRLRVLGLPAAARPAREAPDEGEDGTGEA